MKPDPSNEQSDLDALNDDSVSRYLTDNPEFFNRKADLLLGLSIPHESGAAISLLERQVAMYRERNLELQNRINDFIFNAEENDALFERTRIVILELLKTNNLGELSKAVEVTLKSEFAAHASRLFFIGANFSGSEDDKKDKNENNNVRTLEEKPARKTLGKLYEKKRTFCCELTPEQAKLLFPDTKKDILSAAIIPVHLNETLRKESGTGMPTLVIGSEKHNHFNTSLDTLFLDFIGEILSAHISLLKS
ncbi:MAG: DUF484 family protein [Gammaproteobacteria bacterium]|nr:DUF484 family protein [Gammaproteobacteria bacterium]